MEYRGMAPLKANPIHPHSYTPSWIRSTLIVGATVLIPVVGGNIVSYFLTKSELDSNENISYKLELLKELDNAEILRVPLEMFGGIGFRIAVREYEKEHSGISK